MPLAVDFGSNAVQTQYATHVMDQIEAEGGGDEKAVIGTLADARRMGEERLMTPVSQYMENAGFSDAQSREMTDSVASAYRQGHELAEREALE